MAYIASIGCAVPKYAISAAAQFDFMQKNCHWNEEESRKYKLLYDRSGIDKKHTVLPDFLAYEDKKIYTDSAEPLIENRLEIYNEEAHLLAIEAIRKCVDSDFDYQKITHLITVSCTGMSAPGLDLKLVENLGLKTTIERTSVNFMGCYAAIHALKSAHYICKSIENAQVLVVCVELCSLHFQKLNSMDNIASNLLFGDGAAAVLISNKPSDLEMKSFYSEINFNGQNDMAWKISSQGFLMRLSAYIPELIKADIAKFVENAAKEAGINRSLIGNWAIHPGGRKILDVIKTSLSLTDENLESSYYILKNYGNMSSPTVLFVLADLQEKKKNSNPFFLTAFGPGLTMESLILV